MTVLFITGDGERTAVSGTGERRLDRLATAAGVLLNFRCGGRGVCKGCRVWVGPGRYRVEGLEEEVPEGHTLEVPACRTEVWSDTCRVEVPRGSLRNDAIQVDGRFFLSGTAQREAGRFGRRECDLPPPDGDRTASAEERLRRVLGPAAGDGAAPVSLVRSLCQGDHARGGPLQVVEERGADRHRPLEVRAAGNDGPLWGVAVDLGTTTAVAVLVDLESGHIAGEVSGYNRQVDVADDVAARISACTEAGGLERLHHAVIGQTLNPLIDQLCARAGIARETVLALTVAGNTVMQHLMLGLSPETIGHVPFEPLMREYPELSGAAVGIPLHAQASVYLVPAISGYIGGDLTADILAAGLHERSGVHLLVDIGTNGEIVLAEDGVLWAASAAAGPAFEGGGLRCGCRAQPGAVERLRALDSGDWSVATIDDRPAVGLCGSAIIDLPAVLLELGCIGATGRLDREALARRDRLSVVVEDGREEAGVLVVPAAGTASGVDLVVTERELAEILKAKAALHAAVSVLLQRCGRRVDELESLVLAGGFAQYIHLPHAVRIGLLPAVPENRVERLGNGSLAGAYRALLEPGARAALHRIALLPRTVHLNREPGFQDAFIDGLMLDPSAEGG